MCNLKIVKGDVEFDQKGQTQDPQNMLLQSSYYTSHLKVCLQKSACDKMGLIRHQKSSESFQPAQIQGTTGSACTKHTEKDALG